MRRVIRGRGPDGRVTIVCLPADETGYRWRPARVDLAAAWWWRWGPAVRMVARLVLAAGAGWVLAAAVRWAVR